MLIRHAVDPLSRAAQLFAIKRPVASHWREAGCDEVRCPHHLNGWVTVIDEGSDLGKRQAYYIRRESRRQFKESKDEAGLTRFEFEAGQRCFRQHKLPDGRDPLFLRQGVQRGVIASTVRYEWPRWMDTFNEEMQRAASGR